jgi:hypothetical protein
VEVDWFHFTKEHFEMGWKLCTRSPQLHFWRIGASILQMLPNHEEWWSLYVIEELATSRWMGRSLLQTFAEIY